jgi:hypothetical protein
MIKGLRDKPYHSPITISEQVAVQVEILRRLGLVADHDEAAESLAADAETLYQCDEPGELYVQIPRHMVSLPDLIAVLDSSGSGRRHHPTAVNHSVWSFTTHTDVLGRPWPDCYGYTRDELGCLLPGGGLSDFPVHARLAVHSHSHTPKTDRLLHFLGHPYDKHNAEPGQETQLQSFARAKQEFDAGHPDLQLAVLNVEAILVLALARRIMGLEMPLRRGYLRDATLPRKHIDPLEHHAGRRFVEHVLLVGDIFSGNNGEMALDWSRGTAKEDVGIGLSIGPRLP